MIPHLLIIGGILALAVCSLCLLALHLLPTDFHPIRDAVSAYIASRYGDLYLIQAFACGVCALCLIAALALLHAPVPLVGLILLGCFGLFQILIPLFPPHPDDEHGSPAPRTVDGEQGSLTPRAVMHLFLVIITITTIGSALTRVLIPSFQDHPNDEQGAPTPRVITHRHLAVAAFTIIAIATLLLTWPIQSFPLWRGPVLLLTFAGLVTPLSVVVMFAMSGLAPWRRYIGLAERAIYASFLLWFWLALVPLANAGL